MPACRTSWWTGRRTPRPPSHYLKQRDGGRATFLPLTAIRGEELRERGVENEFGFVGVASRLVRFDPKYHATFFTTCWDAR